MRVTPSAPILATILLLPLPCFAGAMLCTRAERAAAERARGPLAARGVKAIPRLVQLLGHGNRCMRWMAHGQLVKLGRPAARSLLDALSRARAADLQRVTARALAEVLCDRDDPVEGWAGHRRRLLRHLAHGKAQARGVLRLLEGVRACCSGRRRQELLRLGVKGLTPYLAAGHPLCDAALAAVPDSTRGGTRVADRVAALLGHAAHRERALSALRRIGPEALPAARKALRELLRSGARADRVHTAYIIKEMKVAAHFLDELHALLAETGERTVLEAIDAGGGCRKAAHERVLRRIISRPGPLELRHLAVGVLNRAGKKTALDGPIRRKHTLSRELSPVYPQHVLPPRETTLVRLRHAVDVCRAEAGLTRLGALRLGGHSLASHEQHARCLDRHLCGPGRGQFRRAQQACCGHYSGSRDRPVWCR